MADHPITPPQELVNQWRKQAPVARDGGATREQWIATQAARWGADQELEACRQWTAQRTVQWSDGRWPADALCAARRPKPSLKEQAQRILVENGTTLDGRVELDRDDVAIINRALEALSDD